MIVRSSSRWLLWLVPAVLISTTLAIEHFFDFKPPHWSYWISVAIFTLFGVVLLSSPRDVPDVRPAFARAAGATFLILAAFAALSLTGFLDDSWMLRS